MYGGKFYDIGAALQWASKTPAEAEAQRNKSCRLCAEKYGLHGHCTRCPIEYAHHEVMKTIFGIDTDKKERDD